MELIVGAQSVRIRHGLTVAYLKFRTVAAMVEGIGLPERAPLTDAFLRIHHIHEQRVLIDELPAAIRLRSMAQEVTLAEIIAAETHHPRRGSAHGHFRKARHAFRVAPILQVRADRGMKTSGVKIPLSGNHGLV